MRRTHFYFSILVVASLSSMAVWSCKGKDISDQPPRQAEGDAGAPSALERPPVLPRSPSGGLPPELKPPGRK